MKFIRSKVPAGRVEVSFRPAGWCLACWLSLYLLLCTTVSTYTQVASFTVSVFPTITTNTCTVRIYNAHLAAGGIRRAELCSIMGARMVDLTPDISSSNRGIQDLTLNLAQYPAGLYLLRFETGVETFTFKVLKV